jgi:hypothetical protein
MLKLDKESVLVVYVEIRDGLVAIGVRKQLCLVFAELGDRKGKVQSLGGLLELPDSVRGVWSGLVWANSLCKSIANVFESVVFGDSDTTSGGTRLVRKVGVMEEKDVKTRGMKLQDFFRGNTHFDRFSWYWMKTHAVPRQREVRKKSEKKERQDTGSPIFKQIPNRARDEFDVDVFDAVGDKDAIHKEGWVVDGAEIALVHGALFVHLSWASLAPALVPLSRDKIPSLTGLHGDISEIIDLGEFLGWVGG